ncbi:hypothetical protein F5B17DRAFT_425630 [Nemania serpens]|nr:hypothetical protein F5B17DRAFT_425630 [Nemania serpens]
MLRLHHKQKIITNMANVPNQRWRSLQRSHEDSARFIADGCARCFEEYIQLLMRTTIPANISSSDIQIANIFRELYGIVTQRQGTTVVLRFACIQLHRAFNAVEALIAAERKRGLHGKSHNATIAINKFIAALKDADIDIRNSEVLELRRKVKRWNYLAQPSVFFLMTYSDSAESIVKNFKTTGDRVLPLLVRQIEVGTPEPILSACRVLDSAVHQADLYEYWDAAATQKKVQSELQSLLSP